MRPSFVQIAIVILIIVIIFGAPKLPQLARSLGQSMKIFKSEVKDLRDDDESTTTQPGELRRESSQTDAQKAAQPHGQQAGTSEAQHTAGEGTRSTDAARPSESARSPESSASDEQDPQSREK